MSKLGFDPRPRKTVYFIRPTERTPTGLAPKKGVAPVGTVVLLWDNDGNIARGVAVCAATDQFVRAHGVTDAFERAKTALAEKKTAKPIGFPVGKAETVRDASMVVMEAWQSQWPEVELSWKQEFKPRLTAFEKKLLEKAKLRVAREAKPVVQ